MASSSATRGTPSEDLTWDRAEQPCSVLRSSFSRWPLTAPLECGVSSPGSQFLKNGFTSGDSPSGRRPLQGGSQESGGWHAHVPSLHPHPHPQDRTGQVGGSQRPHSKLISPQLPVGAFVIGTALGTSPRPTGVSFVLCPGRPLRLQQCHHADVGSMLCASQSFLALSDRVWGWPNKLPSPLSICRGDQPRSGSEPSMEAPCPNPRMLCAFHSIP